MIKLLMPDIFVDSYEEVNKEMLLQRKISCLICDIDNTLAPHDVERPDEKVIKYIKSLKEAGINVFFVSNNKKARVAYFCRDLDCDYFSFALKPSKHVYKKILKKHNFSKSEVACLGDQLMSDILGANRMGFLSIYTKPLVDKDIIYTKFSRRIEKILIKKIEKREDNE